MMARLLALAVTATLLMAQPGPLASAARTSPGEAEAFWRAALPGAPMPDAILELLRHETDVPDGAAEAANRDDPPPPMNFNYDDYRALPRSEATTAPSPDVLIRAAARDEEETVFFLEDAVRVGESLPLHSGTPRATAAASAGEASAQLPLELYTVRSVRAVEGSSFVVCRGDAGHGAAYGCRATGPARAYVLALTTQRGRAVMTAAAVCRTDTSRWDPEHAAFRLLGVKPGGAAVCHAVPDALVLSAKNGMSPTAY